MPDARERVQMFPPGSVRGRIIHSRRSCPVRRAQGGLGVGSSEGRVLLPQGGGDRSARGDRDGGSGQERQRQTQGSLCWEHFLAEGITEEV